MASCYYDISARLAMILTTILQYPQLIDTIYPAVRALGEIGEDEISKLDETEAKALRAKLEALSELYGSDEEDEQ